MVCPRGLSVLVVAMEHITIEIEYVCQTPVQLDIAQKFLKHSESQGIWEHGDILKMKGEDFPTLATEIYMGYCACTYYSLSLLSCFLSQARQFITFVNSSFDKSITPFWDLVCDAFAGGLKYREENPECVTLIEFLKDMEEYKNMCFTENTINWLFSYSNLKFFAVHGNDSIHAVIKCLMRDVDDFQNILVNLGDNGDYEFMFLLADKFSSKDFEKEVTTKFVLTNSISISIFLWICTIDEGFLSQLQVKEYVKQTLDNRSSENETKHMRYWRKRKRSSPSCFSP